MSIYYGGARHLNAVVAVFLFLVGAHAPRVEPCHHLEQHHLAIAIFVAALVDKGPEGCAANASSTAASDRPSTTSLASLRVRRKLCRSTSSRDSGGSQGPRRVRCHQTFAPSGANV